MPADLRDESHLHLLSIFHYVMGGLYVLGVCFVILHFAMMAFVFGMAEKEAAASAASAPATVEMPGEVEVETGGVPTASAPVAPAPFPGFPKEIMAIMIVFYVVFGLLVGAMAAANFMSARYIGKRRNKTFSIVVAAVNCVQIPFGTVLGVFTIIVLTRPSVQSGYEIREAV